MLASNTILQGRYRVVRQLGQGGMGTVYEAVDQRFESQVALKETLFSEESLRKQFEREARLLNKLRHPAMTRVIDHFTEGDGQFLVMDFVEGEDLWEMLQRRGGAFPLEQVWRWGEQLLDALDYIHTQPQPIIHRDIKPQNLKLTGRGQIILLDFGLAKGSTGHMTTVVTSRSVLGYSLAYAPPEQILKVEQHWVDLLSVSNPEQVQEILRRGTDARSDLYSLGATLLHLLTGKTPPNAPTRALSVWSNRPDPLDAAFDHNVPERVASVLKKSMALMMDERYANAAEMLREWREVEQPSLRGNLDPTIPYTPPPTIASPPSRPERAEQATHPSTLVSPSPPLVQENSQRSASTTKGNKTRLYLAGLVIGMFLLVVLVLKNIGPRSDETSNSTNANVMASTNTARVVNTSANTATSTASTTPIPTPTPAANANASTNNSNEGQTPSTVQVRLRPTAPGGAGLGPDVPMAGASVTVVSSAGRVTKRFSRGMLEFDVPCGETIKIITWYSDGSQGYDHRRRVPCGNPVINLGNMRVSPA